MGLEEIPGGWTGTTRAHVSKPTIVAIEGHCIASGIAMPLWCDLRVAAAEFA